MAEKAAGDDRDLSPSRHSQPTLGRASQGALPSDVSGQGWQGGGSSNKWSKPFTSLCATHDGMPGSKEPERQAAERRPERCRRTQPALPRRPASRPPDSRTGRAGSHQSRPRCQNHTGKSRCQIRCRRSPDRRSRGHRTRVPERSPSWHTRASHKERQEPESAAPCRNPLRRMAESRRPGHVRLPARRAEVADLVHDKTYACPE